MRLFKAVFVETFCRFLFLLPRSIVRALGGLIGYVWFDILRLRRNVIRKNLDLVFPNKSRIEKDQIARASLKKLGANFLEFFTLPHLHQKWIEQNIVVEGWSELETAIQKKRGVYLLSLHMGGYDIAASMIPYRGVETFLISKFFKNRFLNEIWFSIRASLGMKFIEPHGDKTAFEILKAIKKNSAVIFVLDQFMGRPYGIETNFFGQPTGTAYGLALFVIKTGSPVVPVYAFEGQDQKMHVKFLPAVNADGLEELEKEQKILQLTNRYNKVLEEIILKHPDEWLWVHKRWKDFND